MIQLNMKQAAKAYNCGYEPFRKYMSEIRSLLPNFAPDGKLSVAELGYLTIFFSEKAKGRTIKEAANEMYEIIKIDFNAFLS